MVQDALNYIRDLFAYVSLSINEEKSSQTPQTEVEWLGFIYSQGALTLSEKSLQDLEASVKETKASCTVGSLMSLIGKINFMCSTNIRLRPLASLLMGILPH